MNDPFSTMEEGAMQLHELFSSYVKAGFTREEALQLVLAIVSSAAGRGGES
jgi:hypothetical protein